jgi:hypothetical protein
LRHDGGLTAWWQPDGSTWTSVVVVQIAQYDNILSHRDKLAGLHLPVEKIENLVVVNRSTLMLKKTGDIVARKKIEGRTYSGA